MQPLFLDKSRNLSKIVSVLLSASVERIFVSRMRDFLILFTKLHGQIAKNPLHIIQQKILNNYKKAMDQLIIYQLKLIISKLTVEYSSM